MYSKLRLVSRDNQTLPPTTPTIPDEEDVVILNTAEEEVCHNKDVSSEVKQRGNDELEKQENDDDAGGESTSVEITADYKNNEPVNENVQRETCKEQKAEEKERDFGLAAAAASWPVLETDKVKAEEQDGEEDSPVNRIHSEILELTRKISLPEVGLLNLIRATEEAENEAKRQQEAAAGSSPSRESFLLRAMAEHGGMDFSLHGGLKGVTRRDPKQSCSPSPWVPKTPIVGSKTRSQNDEGGKTSTAEKESFSTSPRKDRTVTLNSEGVATDVVAKPQTADELVKTAGKGPTETRRSLATTDRDMLGMLYKYVEYLQNSF